MARAKAARAKAKTKNHWGSRRMIRQVILGPTEVD